MQQIQIRSRRIAYEFWRIPDTELERRVCGIHGGNSRTTVIPRYEGNEVPGRIIYRSVNTTVQREGWVVGIRWCIVAVAENIDFHRYVHAFNKRVI